MNPKNKLFHFSLILSLTLVLAACSSLPGASQPTPSAAPVVIIAEDSISASAKVIAPKIANLSFIAGGQEFTLYVKTGDQVKDGDLLAALSKDALPQNIILAQADLLKAQTALENLLASTSARSLAEQEVVRAKKALEEAQEDYDNVFFPRGSTDRVDQTEAEIDLAKKQLSLAKDAYKRVQNRSDGDSLKAQAQLNLTNAELRLDDLYARLNYLTGKPNELDVEAAKTALAVAQSNLADAERNYERLKEGPDPDDVAAAEAQIKALESILNQQNLLAPFDGTIVEAYANSGESISPGVPVLLLADLSTLLVETTDLAEVDVARIKIGDTAKVTFDALPDTSVTGQVVKIALKNAAGSGVYYTVTIELDDVPEQLRWGMSAFVEIKLTE